MLSWRKRVYHKIKTSLKYALEQSISIKRRVAPGHFEILWISNTSRLRSTTHVIVNLSQIFDSVRLKVIFEHIRRRETNMSSVTEVDETLKKYIWPTNLITKILYENNIKRVKLLFPLDSHSFTELRSKFLYYCRKKQTNMFRFF